MDEKTATIIAEAVKQGLDDIEKKVCEKYDDYIQHRKKQDKITEGLMQDIYAAIDNLKKE